MTKKEIKDLARELLNNMNTTPLEMDVAMDDKSLDVLSAKIVARFSQLRELMTWHDNLYNMSQLDWDFIDMTDEEELLAKIEDLEIEKQDISDDDDNWEYTDEAKDAYVEKRKDDVRDDPAEFLRDFGMEERMDDFIDEDSFIEDVISTDGRGHTLSSYDGEEGEITFQNEWYYVYRTN